MPQGQAQEIVAVLAPKYRSKLEQMMMGGH